MRASGVALLLMLAAAPTAGQSTARDTTNGWNGNAALRLVERARARRAQPKGDTALRSYSAKAAGHVYFYLDRQDTTEQTLVKVDQIALELYWAAPNLTKQRIVGLRDVDRLPNRMYYHLDHLTVVQNGFGNVIRVGDGDEVRDVPHPTAPGSDSIYDFRIADSLTLTFPPQPPVRVFQILVRPRQPKRPGMVGSIYVDQASADIVRMTFTFTPESYVDRRLDYINISVDNGLWNGDYWLPNEQYVEIRRQIPELDFAAGAVIKGRLRVYGYEFNQPFPRDFFFGRPVEAVTEAELKTFDFEESIFAGLDREGLSAPPQIEALRAQAADLLRRDRLSGLPRLSLYVQNASSVLRYNGTEGLYLGMGASYDISAATRLETTLGYAIEPAHPVISTRLIKRANGNASWLRAYLLEPRDIGIRPALPTGLNTLSYALLGRDYTRLFQESGIEAGASRNLGIGRFTGRMAQEWHTDEREAGQYNASPGQLASGQLSGLVPIMDGERLDVSTALAATLGRFGFRRGKCLLERSCASPEAQFFGTMTAAVTGIAESHNRGLRATTTISAGYLVGDPPVQRAFVLGGVGTLPGHDFRGMIGDAYALAELEVIRQVASPWISLRVVGSAGTVNPRPADQFGWPAPTYTSGTSIGAGVGLLWDVLRFDFIKGSGKPRLYFSVKPDLGDLL